MSESDWLFAEAITDGLNSGLNGTQNYRALAVLAIPAAFAGDLISIFIGAQGLQL